MKHNLKNRPWMTPAKANTRTLETLKEESMDFERWFEGFEKELRQRLDFSYADAPQPLERCRRYAQIFKEILGDGTH